MMREVGALGRRQPTRRDDPRRQRQVPRVGEVEGVVVVVVLVGSFEARREDRVARGEEQVAREGEPEQRAPHGARTLSAGRGPPRQLRGTDHPPGACLAGPRSLNARLPATRSIAMSEGKRPGGLTALAVLNFVFGGFCCLGVLGMSFTFALKRGAIPLQGKDKEEAAKAVAQLPEELIYVVTAVDAICAVLLVATGLGYLKQKRIWGRLMGNVASIVAIVGLLIPTFFGGKEAEGFSLGTLVLLVYPVLTLVLLNTTFKEDFVR